MTRPSLGFLGFLLGLRAARTNLTAAETALLTSLVPAGGRVVEVGSYEGATARKLCEAAGPDGVVFLVDPYPLNLRLEVLLGFSFPHFVARRTLRPFGERVCFHRAKSIEAAETLGLRGGVDLVFIDADHSYAAVSRDFQVWSEKLAPHGRLAFHDSRGCPKRPDLTEVVGPVRLLNEIGSGCHSGWEVTAVADSLSVVGRVARP